MSAAATQLRGQKMIPPLLPIWLPLIVAAIVSGAGFAWWMPGPRKGAPPPPRFSDTTAESGIRFVHHIGANTDDSPTTLGGGVVWFDCDGDGDDDLFLVNGAEWPWEESLAKRLSRGGGALYRNEGEGRFTDISAAAGVNVEFQGMSAAAGDFDNDGHTDLFVTGVGANRLFRNRGGGRFEDVTDEVGVRSEDNTWSTGALWMDFDEDGRLDLIVCHYARWPEEAGLAGAFAVALMGRSYGAPTGFIGAPPTVYRNIGDNRFEPVPGSAGIRPLDPTTGLAAAKMLAATPVDANGDGRLDLWLAFHDLEPELFLNEGGGNFRASVPPEERREGASAGAASVSPLALLPGGGIDQQFALWRATRERALAENRGESIVTLGAKLGAVVLDYDGDGRLDFLLNRARLEPDVNRFENGRDFAEAPELFWNRGEDWVPVELGETGAWAVRGVAASDFDQDGDLDLAFTRFGNSPVLWRNEQRADVPWLALNLIATRTAREAGGARVEVHTPRRVHVRTVAPAMGLFAQSTATLHFGLGDDARVRRILVHWPSGARQELASPQINQRLTITEE